jgi:hypothetical protein
VTYKCRNLSWINIHFNRILQEGIFEIFVNPNADLMLWYGEFAGLLMLTYEKMRKIKQGRNAIGDSFHR